jgi:transcriptional regulator with XRE-family HTH domain
MGSKNDLMTKFGKRVAKLRMNRLLTQQQLAEIAGISIDHLSLIERGKRGPSFPTIEKIAKALGVEEKDLFKFD